MGKIILSIVLIFVILSCDSSTDNFDDTKTFLLKISNSSDYVVKNISVEIESLDTGWPDSLFIDSLIFGEETDELVFKFDNTMSNGNGVTLAPSFFGSYSQNSLTKEFSIPIPNIDSTSIRMIIDNESFSFQ